MQVKNLPFWSFFIVFLLFLPFEIRQNLTEKNNGVNKNICYFSINSSVFLAISVTETFSQPLKVESNVSFI